MAILPKERTTKDKYIICPDINCDGFMKERLQCENSKITQELYPDSNFELCPHLDTAKKVVFCYWGHAIEDKVNDSNWRRSDCKIEYCHSVSFAKMSNITIRIALEDYDTFLNLPFNNK